MIGYNAPDISLLLSPGSIAVISANFETGHVGGRVLLNLQKSKYQGKVYPVHPRYDEAFGMKAYPTLMSISNRVDTVVITLPLKSILPILADCVEKMVKFIVIPSIDCNESEEEKLHCRKILKAFSEESGIRVLGPDCPGLFNIGSSVGISCTSYYEPNRLQYGGISLISQGEGLGRTILDANDRGIGFNHWISTGDEADLEISDFINFLANDSATKVIFVIVERLKDEWAFRYAAEAANKAGKPIIVLSISHSEHGADKGIHPAIFKELGVIQVHDLDEMINVGWLFLKYANPQGNRIGIFSYSDGAARLLAEKCRRGNLLVPDITNETKDKIQGLLPDEVAPSNPINSKIHAHPDMSRVRTCLERFSNDPNVDIVFVLFSFKVGIYTEMLARHTVEIAQRMKKPIVPLWTSLSGEREVAYEILVDSKLPFYTTADACVKAVKHFTEYSMKRLVFKEEHPS
ncbi:CoA-binding protein [Peribacillus sp. NPDC060253]|uniref:CoA-binding protein n=1 Tax=Peribacillus sp. NPDC060253 TaxID=3347084 RepID=UPI0036554B0C